MKDLDYYERLEATLENIEIVASAIAGEYVLPEGWAWSVYDFLVEERQYTGEYLEVDQVMEAFEEIGYKRLS